MTFPPELHDPRAPVSVICPTLSRRWSRSMRHNWWI